MLYVIEVTAYYGLDNTLPVKGTIDAAAQKYYPRELTLIANKTPDRVLDYGHGRIIIPGYSDLYWYSNDTPNDATYDLYDNEVLSISNISGLSYVGRLNALYRVRLKSMYGNLNSNIVYT